MFARTLIAGATATLAALAAGCSGFSNDPPGAPAPNPVTAAQDAQRSRAAAHAQPVTITEFRDLERGHIPLCIAAGSDAALWLTDDIDQDAGTSYIVRVTTDGKRTAAYGYGADAYPAGTAIAAGPDGALWVVDEGDGDVLRMTTSGSYTTSPYLGNYALIGIGAGPDGAVWVTAVDRAAPLIVRITPSMSITMYSAGISSGAGLQGITTGPDGALWFTERTGNRIGRITTSGQVTEYANGISPNAQPYGITAGPDGALWFTELAGRIGRITTSGAVTEYSHGTMQRRMPVSIAAGPDGALWFTEVREARIGRITTAGAITEYASGLSKNAGPTCITAGPDGNMWFNESSINEVGRVNLQK
jgi:streptogramin lyase